ncbi:MAG: Stp1/IreP family PP2C-type Ser/Thr phosphatase [Nitrososphaeraceae archaeon]
MIIEHNHKFKLDVGFATDKGKVRINNEDNYKILPEFNLFVIADGMGGHNGGEIASKIAIETVEEYFKTYYSQVDSNIDNYVKKMLLRSISLANEKILSEAKLNSKLFGMGTTIVLGLVSNDDVFISNLGDSRSYIIKKNGIKKIKQITQDHTLLAQKLNEGIISNRNIKNNPYRHILTQALGISDIVNPFFSQFKLENGDYLLFCTDGLTEMLGDNEIFELIDVNYSCQKICNKLIYSSNLRGGLDNITSILVKSI